MSENPEFIVMSNKLCSAAVPTYVASTNTVYTVIFTDFAVRLATANF